MTMNFSPMHNAAFCKEEAFQEKQASENISKDDFNKKENNAEDPLLQIIGAQCTVQINKGTVPTAGVYE